MTGIPKCHGIYKRRTAPVNVQSGKTSKTVNVSAAPWGTSTHPDGSKHFGMSDGRLWMGLGSPCRDNIGTERSGPGISGTWILAFLPK